MQCTCKSCIFDTSFAISEVNFTTGSRAGRRAGSKANMAGQLLAAQLIPSLGITKLAAIPPGKLASHHDFVRLLFHHQQYNFQGFNGLRSVCCMIDSKTKKGRCHEEGDPTSLWCDTRTSCLQLGSPCILAKVKKNWEDARLPLKDQDDHILRVLEKVKSANG